MGRWFMPKGKMSRAQLSQILLIYIGVAADIVELFEAFKEKAVRHSRLLTVLVLIVWTISLLQFCFILVSKNDKQSKNKSRRKYDSIKDIAIKSNGYNSYVSNISLNDNHKCYKKCASIQWAFSLDVIGILIPLLLQDTPFLILRLYFIIKHKIISYTNTFFTAKNSLVILLLVYRLVVIQMESRKKSKNSSMISSPIQMSTGFEHNQFYSLNSTPQIIPHVHHENLNSNKLYTSKPMAMNFSKSSENIVMPVFQSVIYENPTSNTWKPFKTKKITLPDYEKSANLVHNESNSMNDNEDLEASIVVLENLIKTLS